MNNRHFKNFINCYLFEKIEEVAIRYYDYLKDYKMCREINRKEEEEKILLLLQDKLLTFFNAVLQDTPMVAIQNFIEEKNKLDFMIRCEPHGNSPEDLIAEYMVLKEAILYFLPEYTVEVARKNGIVDEMETMDLEVQKYIIENSVVKK